MDVMIKASAATGYTAAGGTVILGLTTNEFAALGGLIVAVVAFVVNAGMNFWFRREHLKLAQKRAEQGKPAQDEE